MHWKLCFHLQGTSSMGNNSYYGCHFLLARRCFPISVENSPGYDCVHFLCIHWITVVDTYRHICSKTRGCCGIKSIFILHIASKTVRIIFKMPCFKSVPRETALTSWLTALCNNGILFYNKNQIGEMEEANCSPKSAMNSLRNNEPLPAHFIPLHTESMFFIPSNM